MEKASGIDRFLQAQESSYNTALEEVKNGSKVSHWIWYIFPQMKNLGKSWTAEFYGIYDLDEAKEYLKNETLRERLIEISKALMEVDGKTAKEIFGSIDAIKVRSCMTLFHLADPEEPVFTDVLKKYYNNELDNKTIDLVNKMKRRKKLQNTN